MPEKKKIDSFLDSYPKDVADLARAARLLLLRALPTVEETLDESARVIGYGYGPGYKGVVCTLLLSRTGVKLGIARGSELPDRKRLMRGEGKIHRHVALQNTADLKLPGLKALIGAALQAWQQRNTERRQPPSAISAPVGRVSRAATKNKSANTRKFKRGGGNE